MSKNTRNRIVLTAVAALLLVTVAIGSTVAWLTAKSDVVTNTFSSTNIRVMIQEHEYDQMNETLNLSIPVQQNSGYKLFPGGTVPKDPYVNVFGANCYVFVEVFNNASDYVIVTPSEKWARVGETNIWGYIGSNTDGKMEAVAPSDENTGMYTEGLEFLKDNKVTVKTSVTNAMLKTLSEKPEKYSLVFKAYALQADHLESDTPDKLWSIYLTDSGDGSTAESTTP